VNKLSGFTLIELIVVMALIMILSVVGIGTYTQATVKGKDTQRKSDLNQIAKAVESFYTDVGRYPLSEDGETNPLCYDDSAADKNAPCTSEDLTATIDGQETSYINIPEDPIPSQYYVYVSDSKGTKYWLYTALESQTDRDLLENVDGSIYEYSVNCGSGVPCNYQLTEIGLNKIIPTPSP